MKLLVLGSTGATGRLLTALAVGRGHDVRTLVRDGSRADLVPGTEVVEGDARSREDVTAALAGVDATASTLGMGLKTRPNGLLIDAVDALIAGAAITGSDRLIMLSSWGVGDTLRRSSLLVRLTYMPGKKVHDEKAEAEAALRTSGLNWTLVYPVALTNGEATGRVRARDLDDVARMPGSPSISRADVAASMITIIEDDLWSRRTVVLDQQPRRRTDGDGPGDSPSPSR